MFFVMFSPLLQTSSAITLSIFHFMFNLKEIVVFPEHNELCHDLVPSQTLLVRRDLLMLSHGSRARNSSKTQLPIGLTVLFCDS